MAKMHAQVTQVTSLSPQRYDSAKVESCRGIWDAAATSTGLQSCIPLTELLDLGHPTDAIISAYAQPIMQGNASQASPGCLQTGE